MFRQSSERSGSCSSLSPAPQFEKTEKSPVEYKTEGQDREVEQAEGERAGGSEKSKRGRRKDKVDREKGEKGKSKRGKVQSPSVPYIEPDREPSLDSSGKVKVPDTEGTEKQRHKEDGSPFDPISRLEPQKERLDFSKTEVQDRDKGRSKKHPKSEINDWKDPLVDSDKLAARKRRFGDTISKSVKPKRGRIEDEPSTSTDSGTIFFGKELESDLKTLDAQKRDNSKSRADRLPSYQCDESDQNSSLRQGENSVPLEPVNSKLHSGTSRQVSIDETPEKDPKVKDEYLDIDLSQSYRKQMEQNRRLQQQLQESEKAGKSEMSQSLDAEDLEHRSLVHEVGKPPQDVTDNSPPSKSKKQDQLDLEVGTKKERVYRVFRPKSEDAGCISPKFHASQHGDEEYTNVPQLINVKETKEQPKCIDNAHPELDVGVKRVHCSQFSKISTPVQDEQRRWESRLKQDLLPDFSRNSEKRRLDRKYLNYRLWPDLEPGEVRSDSEEDRELKPNSPMPSTSVAFPERHRGDRLSESKLTNSLERNKFCSYALDQTITPDTKALLERAKSLSSSREDNWSFLDSDSHFASFRSRKDTEKVDSTPRPTPCWYMKKKKIRSESDDKLEDRKEDPKPEEQERRELFVSRFLHSSIFEQDSRRLQYLKKKHEDAENYLPGAQQIQVEGQSDPEPVVLFHSQFLEMTRLQQQKGKEEQKFLQDDQKDEGDQGIANDKLQEEQKSSLPLNAFESNVHQAEIKPVSPIQPLQTSLVQSVPENIVQEPQMSPPVIQKKELSPQPEVMTLQAPSPKQQSPTIKEERQSEQVTSQVNSITQEIPEVPEPKPLQHELKISPTKEIEMKYDRNEEVLPSTTSPITDIKVHNDTQLEPKTELPELPNSISPMIKTEPDTVEKTETETLEAEFLVREVDPKAPDSYTPEEPVSPPKSRSKKNKSSPTTAVPPSTITADKQTTRKSERIDREKLKRSSSPRGEQSKSVSDSKPTSKSPIHSLEPEGAEKNALSGRSRRRNVRSIYLKNPNDEEPVTQPVKEAESQRGARKRAVEKESGQPTETENGPPPTVSRRGRPPKNRRQGEDLLLVRNERSKPSDTNSKDDELGENTDAMNKLGKCKPTPQALKAVNQVGGSGFGKKADKTTEPVGVESQVMKQDDGPSAENDSKEHGECILETKQGKNKETQLEGSGSQKAGDSAQEVSSIDKSGRPKPTRLVRNSKLEDKSLVFKNLRIRLDVTEVKAILQTGDDDGHDESPKKIVGESPKEPIPEPIFEKLTIDEDAKEESVTPPKVRDPNEALLIRQMELEQAVENIAKLTEDPTPMQFKIPNETQPTDLVREPEIEPEEHKPANPASETELAAAIDSITSEDICSLPQDQIMSSAISPEPAIQALVPDPKIGECDVNSALIQVDAANMGTPKKGVKGRTKAQKRAKGQKTVCKKDSAKEIDADCSSVKSPESLPPEIPLTGPETSPPAAAVITPTSKQDISLPVNFTEVPKVTEVSLKEQPDLPKSSGLPASKSPITTKPQPNPYESTSPSISSTSIYLKPSHQSKLLVSPLDQPSQPKEMPVLANSVVPSPLLENPTVHPDFIARNTSSDLRKILAKPRGIPIPDVKLHLRENEAKNVSHENRPSVTPQPVVRSPSSLASPETKQSVISVIASTATSVISRVCNPLESEEAHSIAVANPFVEKQPPKPVYQPSMEESAYHGPSVSEEGANTGRYIVENTSLSTGPTPTGLRVNTSEGVVVLSHSGQKVEGRQRISAKISQIPPPSAVDIEAQPLVSMPPLKPELYSASQRDIPKGPIPTDHVHSLKSQANIASKHESGSDKLDPYAPVQSGVVKRLQQTPGPSQVLGFHHPDYAILMKHPKKAEGNESPWVSAISPAISPHLPSGTGNHVGFIPGTSTDRPPSHIQTLQEPRSPRKSGHPNSPFAKVSSPIGSSSPKAVSMVLQTGLPTISQYVPSVHHSEQSVIMPPSTHSGLGRISPHRIGPAITMGHLTQGDVRVNTPPLGMNYGMHNEGLSSSWPPGQQRPTSPQAVASREMVLKVNPANARAHEGLVRPPASQLKQDSLPADYRNPVQTGMALDRFNMSARDMRMLMHHQQGERTSVELHPGHITDATNSNTNITSSLSPRPHLLQKGMSDKDIVKQSDLKRATSPTGKDSIMGIRGAVPAIASPQRVQLLSSGPVPQFPEYTNMYTSMRSVHSQFSETSPLGMSQPPRNITPLQVRRVMTHHPRCSRWFLVFFCVI